MTHYRLCNGKKSLAVVVAMQQRAAERECLRKEREERKQKLELEKLVLSLQAIYILLSSYSLLLSCLKGQICISCQHQSVLCLFLVIFHKRSKIDP